MYFLAFWFQCRDRNANISGGSGEIGAVLGLLNRPNARLPHNFAKQRIRHICILLTMEQPITIGTDGEDFIGKRLLVGIRWTSEGEVVREEQFHGPIVEADKEGIVIERTDTGTRVTLPPQLTIAA